MAQNEQTTEEHSTLEQQSQGIVSTQEQQRKAKRPDYGASVSECRRYVRRAVETVMAPPYGQSSISSAPWQPPGVRTFILPRISAPSVTVQACSEQPNRAELQSENFTGIHVFRTARALTNRPSFAVANQYTPTQMPATPSSTSSEKLEVTTAAAAHNLDQEHS